MYSLLFLTYNRRGVVARCFRSLSSTLLRPDVEWVIVDNGSSDGTAQWLQRVARHYPDQVRLMLRSDNAGVAGGRQILFDAARGDVLISLDSDVEARAVDWLERLVQPLECPDIWMAGPGGAFVTPDWCSYEAPPPDYVGPVDTCSGFCQAFRRSVLEQGFRFDMAFNPRWHEDTDMCLWIRSQGGTVWHTGDIGLFHLFSYSGDDGSGAQKQRYLAGKWAGKGLVRIEREGIYA